MTTAKVPTPAGASGNRVLLRFVAVGLLALSMGFPLLLIQGRVNERASRYQSVLHDIASVWGREQVLQGPLLVVPFIERHDRTETVRGADGLEHEVSKTAYVRRKAVVLPETLNLDVVLQDERRHRGIYESLVYTADLAVSGTVVSLDLSGLSDHLDHVEWDKASLIVGLSDTRAIGEVTSFLWDGAPAEPSPGTGAPELLASGFHAPLEGLEPGGEGHTFALRMVVNGSHGFRFAPFGKVTDVTVKSPWPHPSFQGSPTSRTVGDDGFEASWRIPHLTRNYPQQFTASSGRDLSEYMAGVDLFEPVQLYDKVTRATKYGLLFVCLTFVVFVLLELKTRAVIHPVQYGLVGIALSLFYLTLLALAEHIGFLKAYLAASAVIVGMVATYAQSVMRPQRGGGLIIGALLSVIYGVLFTILRMEDYALLAGSGLLLAATAAMMYATRNVDGDGPPREPPLEE